MKVRKRSPSEAMLVMDSPALMDSAEPSGVPLDMLTAPSTVPSTEASKKAFREPPTDSEKTRI